jgi:transcriptional regulator with XRE-family HTH domain
LATALTGLRDEERNVVFRCSDEISRICGQLGISLYQPREHTDPVIHADRPARDVYLTDRERVLTSDLVVALCTHPSHGVGAENEIACSACIPLVYIAPRGQKVSKMLLGSFGASQVIAYADDADLRAQLSKTLQELMPTLRQRREWLRPQEARVFPGRLKELRERSGILMPRLATLTGLSTHRLEVLENGDETVSVPTVIEIRRLTAALGVPTSYLFGEAQPLKDPTAYKSLMALKDFAREKYLHFPVYEALWDEYYRSRTEIGFVAKARDASPLTVEDWSKRYEALIDRGRQRELELVP